MPRNVVSGEFTKVVQRVPVRIQIEKDDRWPNLRAGLSVRAIIEPRSGRPGVGEAGRRGNGGSRNALQPDSELTEISRQHPAVKDESTQDGHIAVSDSRPADPRLERTGLPGSRHSPSCLSWRASTRPSS